MMFAIRLPNRLLELCLTLALSVTALFASSTIFDGVIVSVDGETIVVRTMHHPYSSVPIQSTTMTHRDGSFDTETYDIDLFLSYYIDEVPVTKEQMLAVLQPGVRVATMENQGRWYFSLGLYAQ